MIEIGAGGGSIARVDQRGLLQVGPDSAGADPGPACYGRGNPYPTVTDCDLLLGYLDENSFLGGQMKLDDEIFDVKEGDAVYVPPQVKHQLINNTEDWCEHLLITAEVAQD